MKTPKRTRWMEAGRIEREIYVGVCPRPPLDGRRGRPWLWWLAVLLVLPAAWPSQGAAAPIELTARWVGGTGNWSVATNWDIGRVPNNSGGTNYSVVLDVAGTPLITLNQAVTVNSVLTYVPLQITSGGTLTLASSGTNLGVLAIAGAGFCVCS